MKIETGDSPDSITVESFKAILATKPDMIQIVDVRDTQEFEAVRSRGQSTFRSTRSRTKSTNFPRGSRSFSSAPPVRGAAKPSISSRWKTKACRSTSSMRRFPYKGGDAFEIQ